MTKTKLPSKLFFGIIQTMKTVLVTGANDGIGKSIACKFSKQKNNLILFGRDQAKLEAVKAECETNGSKVETFAFDLTNFDKLRETVDSILKNQSVDVLINNAGIWHKVGDLTSLNEDKIQEVINTNLTCHILLTRQLLDQMRNRRDTAIVNIISKSGIVAQLGQAVYTASKYGMKGFTDVLREDTKEEPIRIAAVYQSGTHTDMFKKAGEDFSSERFTEPDDLADVVVFMLSRPEKIWLNEVYVTY